MESAQGTYHGAASSRGLAKGLHEIVSKHGGGSAGRLFHVPAKNVQAFHAEAAKAGYFHGSRGHYVMHYKKHAPDEQFSEGQEDYLPPDATPVTLAPPVLAPMVQFREEAVSQFAEKPKTAKQEIKARAGIRGLQDKILSHPATQKFAQDHGEHHPLFEGGPSVSGLRAFIHIPHLSKLEQIHHDLYGKKF